MIQFFRRVFQKLLSESKLKKYLLYAVGEIVLMIFGIMGVNTSTKKYTFPSREGIKGWVKL